MVLPLAAFGVWLPSALAGTVAGMVTNQNTAAPMAASTRMTVMSLRKAISRLGDVGIVPLWRILPRRARGGRPAASNRQIKESCAQTQRGLGSRAPEARKTRATDAQYFAVITSAIELK